MLHCNDAISSEMDRTHVLHAFNCFKSSVLFAMSSPELGGTPECCRYTFSAAILKPESPHSKGNIQGTESFTKTVVDPVS